MEPTEVAKQLRKPEGEAGLAIAKVMNDGNAAMYTLTMSMMDFKNGDQLLEIGFGNGLHIAEVLKYASSMHYCGIDFSNTMVQEATKINQQLISDGQVEIKEANVSAIPYPNDSFDKIFTINTLYFWDNPSKDIHELYRVLKKGGSVYIGIRPKYIAEKIPFTQWGFRLYEYEEVEQLLKSAGFTEITMKMDEEKMVDFNGHKLAMRGMCITGVKR